MLQSYAWQPPSIYYQNSIKSHLEARFCQSRLLIGRKRSSEICHVRRWSCFDKRSTRRLQPGGARQLHCLCCKDSVRSTKQFVPLHGDKTQHIYLLWDLDVVSVWVLYRPLRPPCLQECLRSCKHCPRAFCYQHQHCAWHVQLSMW